MKRISSYLLAGYVFCLVLSNCQKHSDNNTPPVTPTSPTPPILDELISGSLQGRVIDETGTPVNNATISAGSTISTNSNYIFALSNSGYGSSSYRYFYMSLPAQTTGNFNITSVGTEVGQIFYSSKSSDPIHLTISEFGSTGQNIRGTLVGNLYIDTTNGLPFPFTGNFKVVRNF